MRFSEEAARNMKRAHNAMQRYHSLLNKGKSNLGGVGSRFKDILSGGSRIQINKVVNKMGRGEGRTRTID
jgi:hypothetical protein